jgi:protein SCO1/2
VSAVNAFASFAVAPQRISLRLIGALCCLGLLLAGGWLAFNQLRLIGSSAPDFTLTDQDGHPWTLSHERGLRSVALFFGYTHCPDVCPTTLAHLIEAKRLSGKDGSDLQIVFVTVDASRDTPPTLKRYVRLFGPEIVGLTGDARATRPVYSAYHVWHQSLPGGNGAGYLVSHSSAVYLIDRSGRLRSIADWSDEPAHLAAQLKDLTS